MTDSVESLVAYCREYKRVCPMPRLWNKLWEMLPNRARAGNAWHDTPALLKMLRLADHIELAAQHGALESVAGVLRELRKEDWHHVGE
jgi:hypothetical protein